MKEYKNDTRQIIMDIAKKHFMKYGYAGTNLEMICQEANLTRGPLYYYFKNKKELYIAAVEDEINQAISKYTDIFNSDDSIFTKLYKDIVFCSTNQSIISQVGLGGKSEPRIEGINDSQKEVYNIKKNALEKAMQNGELDPKADVEEMIRFLYIFVYGCKSLGTNEFSLFQEDNSNLDQNAKLFIDLIKKKYCVK